MKLYLFRMGSWLTLFAAPVVGYRQWFVGHWQWAAFDALIGLFAFHCLWRSRGGVWR